jgi:hypothetical protein
MLLVISPSVAVRLGYFSKFELVGPDVQGFYALQLSRGIEAPIQLQISRSEREAQGVFDSVIRAESKHGYVCWDSNLALLFKQIDGDVGRPTIALRDIEPRVRLELVGPYKYEPIDLTTEQLKQLLGAVQAGRAFGNFWTPREARYGGRGACLGVPPHHVAMDGRDDVPTFIRRLQQTIARLDGSTSTKTTTLAAAG